MLCSIECCYSHPIDSDCIATNRATYLDGSHNSFIEDLTAWGKITEHISIYDYITNFAHWAQTFPNFDVMWENARIYAENNVNELYPLGNYAGQDVEFGDLRCYLLSKLLWDPYMSKEKYSDLMDEFLANVYGPGWENIRAYIDLAEELSSENHFGIYNSADGIYGWPGVVELNPKDSYPGDLTVDMIRNYESVDWTQYNNWFKDYEGEPTIISEGERLFKAAMALAETDEQKAALDKAYCQVEYIRLVYEYLRISVGSGSIGKILTNFMAQHPDDFTSDEKRELRVAIIQFANGHYYDTYAQHCSDFVEKIKSYGVTSLREGKTINSNLDFTELPEDWYD